MIRRLTVLLLIFFIPSTLHGMEQPPPAAESTTRIITWNVLYGFNHRKSTDQAVTWLNEQRPDVLALQELNGFTAESLASAAANWNHPHAAILKEDGFPVGLTSRTPIEVRGRHTRHMHHGWLHCRTGGIHFLVVHLSPFRYQHRQSEAKAICQTATRLMQQNQPVIVLGDFNSFSPADEQQLSGNTDLLQKMRDSEQQHPHVRNLDSEQFDYSVMQTFLNAGLADAWQRTSAESSGACGTYPTRINASSPNRLRPTTTRIDFILLSPDLLRRRRSATILTEDASLDQVSDHYPVRVSLTD